MHVPPQPPAVVVVVVLVEVVEVLVLLVVVELVVVVLDVVVVVLVVLVEVELVEVVDVLVVEVVEVDVVLVVVVVVHGVVVRQPITGGHGIGGENEGDSHAPQPELHPDALDHDVAEPNASQRQGPHAVVLLVLDVEVVLVVVVLQHGSDGPDTNERFGHEYVWPY